MKSRKNRPAPAGRAVVVCLKTLQASQEDLAQLRAGMSRLTPIPDAQWAEFAQCPRELTLRKGDLLVRQGETQILAGFVMAGLVRTYYLTPKGDEFIRNFAAEGGFVSAYGSAIRREPSNLTVEALETTRLLVMPYAQLEEFYPRHMCWQEFGRRLAEAYYSLRELHAYQLMSMKGSERYEAFKKTFPNLIGRVPQKHVASYLGMNAVSLNRLIAGEIKRKR